MVDLIAHRLAFVPRYRQRVRGVPGGLANPKRGSMTSTSTSAITFGALPSLDRAPMRNSKNSWPGSCRPLDQHRPLWKSISSRAWPRIDLRSSPRPTMPSSTAGYNTVDIGQVILDGAQDAEVAHPPAWRPSREPTGPGIARGRHRGLGPGTCRVHRTVRSGVSDVKAAGAGQCPWRVSDLGHRSRVPVGPESPERQGGAGPPVRHDRHGPRGPPPRATQLAQNNVAEDITVNDVVLATLAGAFQAWLLTRASRFTPRPPSVRWSRFDWTEPTSPAREPPPASSTCRSASPGQPCPAQISFAMRQQMEGGGAMGADTPRRPRRLRATDHARQGARLAGAFNRRLYNVAVTNVPGPQRPLWCRGRGDGL